MLYVVEWRSVLKVAVSPIRANEKNDCHIGMFWISREPSDDAVFRFYKTLHN